MTPNKNKVLCSTGTIVGRSNNYDYTLIEQCARKVKCDGFEFMVESPWYADNKIDEIISYFMPYNINFWTMHTDKNIGEMISRNEAGDIDEALRIFELNCKAASKLGVKLLVLHLWGGRPSDQHIDVNIKTYAKLLETAGKYNLILTVENVVCNTYNAVMHMKKLYETYGKAMKFTIDIRHAAFHNMLKETCEADFLWKNNLVPHFHIADWGGSYMDWSRLRPVLPPGEGDINFDYFKEFLKKIDYAGSFTLEAAGARTETGGIDVDKLNKYLGFVYEL